MKFEKDETLFTGRLKSIGFALKGAIKLITTEHSVMVQSSLAVLMTLAGFYFEIERVEWMMQILVFGLVLSIEGLNTAVEKIADFIHPDYHERIGFIKDIEKIILKKAILEAEPLLKKHNLKLALNLSIKQFLERDYIDLLAKYGKSKDFLEIEITESTAIMDLDESINLINDYKKLGVTVAIDDFGIGYS